MVLLDLMSTLVAIIVSYLYLYFVFINLQRKRRAKRKNAFVKAMKEGLKAGSITTIDDVVNIYKGVAGLSSEDLSYRYNLSKVLREFLVDLISKNKSVLNSNLDDNIIRDWKEKISDFIQKNEAISPYADLPAAERNILSDISSFLKKGDTESVTRKTLELAGMIQARNDDLNRIRNINRWAVPLSAIGLILTIIFGFLALK